MDKLATMDTIGSSFRPWLSCQGICLLNRHQTGDTDSVQPVILLPVQRDSPLTQFEVGGIALGRMNSGITEDNHALLILPNQPLKGVIRDIGRGTCPRYHQPHWFSSRQSLPPTIHR